MTPKALLSIVCKYYGIKDIKGLAESARPSVWRYPIVEEARQMAGLVLQKHCALSVEDVAAALKPIQLNKAYIQIWATQARRRFDEDALFRVSVENVERMIIMAIMMKSMS